MATKDIVSDLEPRLALFAAISSDTDTDGSIIDTADFDLGLMFVLSVPVYTDGAYELQLFESDDSGMAGATQIVAPAILPTDSGDSVSASALSAAGSILEKIGSFNHKRYVRPRIVSTGTTTGATVVVTVVQKGEVLPV